MSTATEPLGPRFCPQNDQKSIQVILEETLPRVALLGERRKARDKANRLVEQTGGQLLGAQEASDSAKRAADVANEAVAESERAVEQIQNGIDAGWRQPVLAGVADELRKAGFEIPPGRLED